MGKNVKNVIWTMWTLFLLSSLLFTSTTFIYAQNNEGTGGQNQPSVDETVSGESLSLSTSEIFLDGVNGDDGNDGSTPAKAVKTFAKAKDLAAANQTIEKIFVTGTVAIHGEISLEGTNAKIVRDPQFAGYLFLVPTNSTATLKEIVIDGSGEEPTAKKSLLHVVGRGSVLQIQEGTVLENNIILNSRNNRSFGGAIYAGSSSAVHMTGGTIRQNQAVEGGGIALSGAKMIFTGGSIEGNNANRLYDTDVQQYYGAGGGILLTNGAKLEMSGQAIVANNTSAEIGGGISVGSTEWSDSPDLFVMNGGILRGNEAGASGGGLFVQAGLGKNVSKAEILAGLITENKMNGTGRTNKAFGGGGIYVNGMPEYAFGTNWSNGELYLKNVLITENRAKIQGAGLAVCPVSKTFIHVNEGGAIYKNESPRGKDFYLLSSKSFGVHSGEPLVKLEKIMLGGKPYLWKDDQNNPYDIQDEPIKIPSGNAISLNNDNFYSDAEISGLAKVIIRNNESVTRGGGVGSNGTVIIGEENEKIDVEIRKTWAEGLKAEPVEIDLRAKILDETGAVAADWSLQKVVLNAENQFKYVFENLPAFIHGQETKKLLYLKENESPDYEASVEKIFEVEEGYKLSFVLNRPEFSDNENLTATYQEYHQQDPSTGVFDEESWSLNDFRVKHIILDKDEVELAHDFMVYNKDDYNWKGTIKFSDLNISTKEVEVQYYDNKGTFVAPWLLEYKLYLSREGDKTILKVPDLWPMNRESFHHTPEERVIQVNDLKVESGKKRFVIKVHNNPPPAPPQLPKTKVVAKKVWQGVQAEDMPEVKLFLLKNGVRTEEFITLNRENNWQSEFVDLPLKDDLNSPENQYTVVEDGEKDGRIRLNNKVFEVTYEGTAKEGFSITNKYDEVVEWPKKDIPVYKKWIGNAMDKIEVILYQDGREIERAYLSEESSWTHVFRGLEVYDLKDGHKYTYTIEEVAVAGYTSNITGDSEQGFYIINRQIPNIPRTGEGPTEVVPLLFLSLASALLYLRRKLAYKM